jgi:hypothetical protein
MTAKAILILGAITMPITFIVVNLAHMFFMWTTAIPIDLQQTITQACLFTYMVIICPMALLVYYINRR